MITTNEAPVLLITFNRADNTCKVFDKIREAKVKKLYVANDAPRIGNKDDEANRNQIRELLNKIDWDCDLHTLFHEKNQGNGFGPVAALNWVFENEEKAIILEDDCVPSIPFFEFCNHCLTKYEDDKRVWIISGRSHHPEHPVFQQYDYIFSRYAHTWGWATWKRAWTHFDMTLSNWQQFYEDGGFENVYFSRKIGRSENRRFRKYVKKPINNWDSRWGLVIDWNSGFGIVPSQNLIENIGYYGIHTKGKTKSHALLASETYEFKKEPKFVVLNRAYEDYHYKNHIKKGQVHILIRGFKKILRIIKGID
jgi:hypothetical protein